MPLHVKFSTAQRQRCVVHKIQNVLGYIPKERRPEVEPELKAIFYQQSRDPGRPGPRRLLPQIREALSHCRRLPAPR